MTEADRRSPIEGEPGAEMVDVLDSSGHSIGRLLESEAESTNALFANILVFVFDPSGHLWIRSRPHQSSAHAGRWDVSAGGPVRAGEDPAAAARRTLAKDTGFVCDLQFVTTFDNRFEDERGRQRRRRSSVYIAVTDLRPPSSGASSLYGRIRINEVVERVSAEPSAFVPSFLAEFAYAAAAFNSRNLVLQQAMSRHPATSWRHVTREPISVTAPHTVDLRLLGLCQLRCAWCWGPEHLRTGSLSPEQWQLLIAKLHARGTRQIVLSGGEPTLSEALSACVATAKELRLKVTLSSNGIRLAAFEDLLADIDDLGIPIDGSTPAMNDRMRARSLRHDAWEKAIDAILLTQRLVRAGRSAAQVTVRIVVARANLADVPSIPESLRSKGVDLADLRIKMYQVEPFGPHFGQTDFDQEWAITPDEALNAYEETVARCPEGNVELQLYAKTGGRYFLVDPDGNATGTDFDSFGAPIEVSYGNLVEDLDAALDAYLEHQRRLMSAA